MFPPVVTFIMIILYYFGQWWPLLSLFHIISASGDLQGGSLQTPPPPREIVTISVQKVGFQGIFIQYSLLHSSDIGDITQSLTPSEISGAKLQDNCKDILDTWPVFDADNLDPHLLPLKFSSPGEIPLMLFELWQCIKGRVQKKNLFFYGTGFHTIFSHFQH